MLDFFIPRLKMLGTQLLSQATPALIIEPINAKSTENSLYFDRFRYRMAEGAGFEPAWAFALTVFKTAPL